MRKFPGIARRFWCRV